jgi:hypothetical protein
VPIWFPKLELSIKKAQLSLLKKPPRTKGYHLEALQAIVEETQGYPCFLQKWGRNTWEVTDESPIKFVVADRKTESYLKKL